MTVYNSETGKWVCEICGEYIEEDRRKVNMHEITCKKKNEAFQAVEEAKEEVQPERKERVPFGVPQKRLPDVSSNDGFQYRVVNDNWAKDPGRVQRAMRGGYEKVEGYDPMPVGVNDDGSPIKGVLLRIPKEWYEEDQKTKQKVVDKVDEAIKTGKLESQPGDNRYIPQGIRIHSNTSENG